MASDRRSPSAVGRKPNQQSRKFALAGSELDRERFLGRDKPSRPNPWLMEEWKSPVPYDPPKLSEYERILAREKMRERRKRK